jgi:hypothetical protein
MLDIQAVKLNAFLPAGIYRFPVFFHIGSGPVGLLINALWGDLTRRGIIE